MVTFSFETFSFIVSAILFQILSTLESESGTASPEVSEIVEHIWREAVGEVESVLQIPVSSVQLDQVNHIRGTNWSLW